MGGWIGVGLDGTLAKIEFSKHIGDPIIPMVNRVIKILPEYNVKIVTPRIKISNLKEKQEECHKIQKWLKLHLGTELELTSEIDFCMVEFWDFKSVQYDPITNLTYKELYEKLMNGDKW